MELFVYTAMWSTCSYICKVLYTIATITNKIQNKILTSTNYVLISTTTISCYELSVHHQQQINFF